MCTLVWQRALFGLTNALFSKMCILDHRMNQLSPNFGNFACEGLVKSVAPHIYGTSGLGQGKPSIIVTFFFKYRGQVFSSNYLMSSCLASFVLWNDMRFFINPPDNNRKY